MTVLKTALGGLVAAATLAILGPSAQAQEPPIRDDCYVGKGPAVTPDGQPCRPANPKHTPAETALIEAKTAKAEAYQAYQRGEINAQQLEAVSQRFWTLSGEKPVTPEKNRIARALGHDPTAPQPTGSVGLMTALANFWPFEQFYDWQCGPATAESVLWYKGPHTSQYAVDGSTITADRQGDQWTLGYSYYTDANAPPQQTSWNPRKIAPTLNRWRVNSDTGFYLTGSVSSSGGDLNNLTKSDVMARITDDIDFDYPVAENVEYGGNSYRPLQTTANPFLGPSNWQHWDTVYGYYDLSGTRYVQIGQVWGTTRFYDVPWDQHWTAIGNYGHGIVY